MAFGRRRGSSINVVHSVKHIVDSEGALSAGATSTTPLLTVVNQRSVTFDPLEVNIGEKVNGIFLTIFVIGATGAPLNGSINWYIIKTHEGQVSLPTPGITGASNLRNQIFHEEKGLAGSGDGTPMAFKGVIALPKSFRRMRQGDGILIILNSNDATNDATFCIKAIYKSFS